MGSERNPWPENSDFGKRWRQGYDAGRRQTLHELMPAIEKIAPPSPAQGL